MNNPPQLEKVARVVMRIRVGQGLRYRSGALQRICAPMPCECVDGIINLLDTRFTIEEREAFAAYYGA